MKSFIVAALLVAAVAGQSTMDILKLNKDTKSMLKFDRPVYPMVRDFDRNNMIDTTQDYYKYTGEFDYDTTTVYQLDEIMALPLFREYMNLPIFRQFWEYPMFQKYVASIYFQRFWQIPQFQQYFVNPTYFYKYIYPIVQLFKYEQTTMNTFNNYFQYKSYPYNTYTTGQDYYYGQQYDLLNKNIPTMCQYNQVYCKALLEKMYTHMYTTMMMPYGQQEEINMEYPFHTTTTSDMYNPYVSRMIQGYYNRYPTYQTYQTEKMTPYMFNNYQTEKMTPYMFNKERMYNNVHFNKDMYMNTFENNKMIDDVVIPTTESRFENIRPTMFKTFDNKFMPTMVKA